MRILAALALSALLSGCAGYLQVTDWKPALDHMTDARPERIAKDERECKILDSAYVGYGILEFVPDLIVGAAKAFTFGASPSKSPDQDSGSAYKSIYSACMKGRGHFPLN
jgi:hypothetical protein